MEKENSKSFIKGTPARIIPAGQTDLYEIKVEEAPLSPFLVGRTVTVDLPAEIRAEIGRQTGVNMSYDTEYQVSGFFKSLRVEGFVGTVFSKFEPFTQHEKSSFFRSFVRSAEGKLLFSMDISDIRVLIGEPVSAAFTNRVRPERPCFPVWLSPKEQMRLLRSSQIEKTAFALQANQILQNLLDKSFYSKESDTDCIYNPDCDKSSDMDCDGDCENCFIEGIFGVGPDGYRPDKGCCEDEDEDFDEDFSDEVFIAEEFMDEHGHHCESYGTTCYENDPTYRDDGDDGSEDDFECGGDCENCPVTCEDDEDDSDDSFEYSGRKNFDRGLWDLLGKAWSCEPEKYAKKPKQHAGKPVAEEALAFDDCPFMGDGRKYFRAFIGTPGDKKAKKKIKDYINTICKTCKHNEDCNSDHKTKFFLIDDPADKLYISRFGNHMHKSKAENGVYIGQSADPALFTETDRILPDYFGQELYSFTDKTPKGHGKNRQISYTGLFVKNFTGSVTLVPGILPLFDPHTRTLTCIEMCGLPEGAFNTLYKIINKGGCPAVYVSIPEKKADFSYASTEEIGQMYIRGEKGRPLSPGRIIICDTAEGHFTAPVVSDIKIRKTADKKGKK